MGVLTQSRTYSGNIAHILTEESGGAFFIDAGKAYLLKNEEHVVATLPAIVVNASTGLLNTPVLEETMGRFEMIFEPTLNIGTLVTVREPYHSRGSMTLIRSPALNIEELYRT